MSAEERRQQGVIAALPETGCDAIVLTDLDNVRYLTGLASSNALVLLSADRRVLFTDSRYATVAKKVARGVDVVIAGRDLMDRLGELVRDHPSCRRLGVEADHVTLARRGRIAAAVGDGADLVETSGVVEELRVVKDPSEIASMREASRLADIAFAWCEQATLVGRTERSVAWELASILEVEGAEGPSFPIIVAAGKNGSLPHAVPSNDLIPTNSLVVVDLGAIKGGYASDCTRTYATGPLAQPLAAAFDACLAAQAAAVAAVRPGVSCGELDKLARDMISDAGFGEAFGHGLGHGVGLAIHERPWVRPEGAEMLAAGMAITIEPGIYLEGLGGVRIEDLVIVTPDGGEVLTKRPRGRDTN